ncbi:MAG: streptogrisin [Sphingomonadales bacterium]|jgi:hypothetical protein|nr:streptogrisin [Sphingomonadales bacterium]
MFFRTWIQIVALYFIVLCSSALASPGDMVALQGLRGNTLVAGKTTALRLYMDPATYGATARVVVTIVRPDGSTVSQSWLRPQLVAIPKGSQGASLVARVRGSDLSWVGNYQIGVRALGSAGTVLATFLIDKVQLLPTRDIIVAVDRIHADNINPGTSQEVQGIRDSLTRLAAIWPVRDGIGALDGDRSAGLRYVLNNQPQSYGCNGDPKTSDCQLCPFLLSRLNRAPGLDSINLGIGTRSQDAGENMGGIAPNFCPNQSVGWASVVMSAPSAPGMAQETGHVFGLEPSNDPHFDRTPGIQSMHSVDNTIEAADAEQGFDIQTNAAFPNPTFDAMHQQVCGCVNTAVSYNAWDWEYLRAHFAKLASTGPTAAAHFTTSTAPAVAGLSGSVYFFARRADGRVFYNRAPIGQAGLGWGEVEGDGHTDNAPAAAAIGDHVFVAVRGRDGRVYLNQADAGQPFGSWFPMAFTTDSTPALAAVGNRLFVFAKGLDQRIYLSQAVMGKAFSGWFEVQGAGRTNTAPSAAAVGTHVFVAIRGLDGNLQLNQADLGHAFGGWFGLNLVSDTSPGLASINDRIFVFGTAMDRRVLLKQAVLGRSFSEWFEVQGNVRSDTAPAAASVGAHVFVVVKGNDGRFLVNQADLGHTFGQWLP